MEINDRINDLIVKMGVNKSAFAVQVGVSQPIITHITSGRNNPGLEVIQKILTNCPEVNPEWLILGRGDMLLNNTLNKKIINDLLSDTNNTLSLLENEVLKLRERFNLLYQLLIDSTG